MRRAGSHVLLLLAASILGGCGGDPPADPFGFRFDRSTYPGVSVVPRDAFEADRASQPGEEDGTIHAAFFERVNADATTNEDTPSQLSWNDAIQLAPVDDRDFVRFFLVYEVEESPSAGTCTVRIRLVEGLPYDPARAPLATYVGTATLGETDRDGALIDESRECRREAAHRAFDALGAAGHLDPGWSFGPPAHLG